MKVAAVCGHFAYGTQMADGQTIKTRNVTDELYSVYGKERVLTIDTHGMKNIAMLPIRLFRALIQSKNMIIMPDENGIQVIPWILFVENILLRRNIFYIVIGGWLPSMIKKHPILQKLLKSLSAVFVETKTMKTSLNELGFQNIVIMRNFKRMVMLSANEISQQVTQPYRLCMFSRVCKEKGIQDAIEAVTRINTENEKQVYKLDIYGMIDPEQIEWFNQLMKDAPAYIHYGGVIAAEKSVETIRDSYLMLFPTHYYTEGIPGTIIDALSAAIPVVYSKWQSADDILNSTIGFGYDFDDITGLYRLLNQLRLEEDDVLKMKQQCLVAANEYVPQQAIRALTDRLS